MRIISGRQCRDDRGVLSGNWGFIESHGWNWKDFCKCMALWKEAHYR